MTWGFCWTIARAAESWKICTLMAYFCRKYAMFELENTEEFCSEKCLMVSKMTGEIR